MATIDSLDHEDTIFDYVIVGGGTAGCVVASRLAEYLPDRSVLLIEGGPSDHGDNRILDLKNIVELWGSELDYNYTSIEQEFGNSNILHSRAKVLGGCSSHNGGISFIPFRQDAEKWQQMGADGWTFEEFVRLVKKLRVTINKVAPQYRNHIDEDFIDSCAKAFGIPRVEDFNQKITQDGYLKPSTGFISITYDPESGNRSSASTAYIHPILEKKEHRPNLTILTNSWVDHINVEKDVATGVNVRYASGRRAEIKARIETVLCAGSVDTPRLMLLSGLGPRAQLEDLGIPVIKDLPGVGENLMDHPETIVMWELNEPFPNDKCINHSEAAMLLRREPINANGDDGDMVDTLFHTFSLNFDSNIGQMGYECPNNAYCMIPNIPRPRSRGRIYLVSPDPQVKPALDFRYLSDEAKYDQKTLVYMIKAAREVAKQEPFKKYIKREVAPGPLVRTDAAIVEYNRLAHNTVYHPCGTTKMGNIDSDHLAVVDPELRVKGIKGLRVADAGVFPIIPSINPMLTVLAVGERAAELIAANGGSGPKPRL